MIINILYKEEDSIRVPIAAFTSQELGSAYAESLKLEGAKFQTADVNKATSDTPEKIFIVYLDKSLEKQNPAGYHANKFNAQVASRPKGYIGAIDVNPEPVSEEEAAALEAGETPGNEQDPEATQTPFSKKQDSPKASQLTRPATPRKDSFDPVTKKRFMQLGGAIALWIIVAIYVLSDSGGVNFQENVESVDWLPEGCTNVSFYKSEKFNIFEADADWNAFKAFAKAEGLKYERLRQPIEINTYRRYAAVDLNQIPQLAGLSEEEQWNEWLKMATPTIEDGFGIFKNPSNPDITVKCIYDNDRQKIFYWSREVFEK